MMINHKNGKKLKQQLRVYYHLTEIVIQQYNIKNICLFLSKKICYKIYIIKINKN